MIKKLIVVGAGLGAFVVAAIAVSLISSIVSALIPGRSPDPPGKLEQPIEEKATADYKATLNPQSQTNAAPAETQTPAPQAATQDFPVPQESAPSPAPVPVAPPAPRSSGPGNFDSPPSYTGGGIYSSGPGNM